MQPLTALIAFLGIVFLGGTLLAPWLYYCVQTLATHFPALQTLAAAPFHRYVNRCFIIIALVGLGPFLRRINVRSFAGVGLTPLTGNQANLARGGVLGFGSLAVAALLTVACGGRVLVENHSLAEIIRHLASATLSAVVVAILEELFFRGALFHTLRAAHSLRTAVWISSAVYALLHFFARTEQIGPVEWHSGLALLPLMMRGFCAWDQLLPAFINLTLAGVILALARERTGNLYCSIGLHAGWIFWLKFYNFLTRDQPGVAVWFWGSGKLIDGWLALGLLALTLRVVWRWPKISTEPCRV